MVTQPAASTDRKRAHSLGPIHHTKALSSSEKCTIFSLPHLGGDCNCCCFISSSPLALGYILLSFAAPLSGYHPFVVADHSCPPLQGSSLIPVTSVLETLTLRDLLECVPMLFMVAGRGRKGKRLPEEFSEVACWSSGPMRKQHAVHRYGIFDFKSAAPFFSQ